MLAVAAGALLHLPPAAWAVLALAIGMVLFAELLNCTTRASRIKPGCPTAARFFSAYRFAPFMVVFD